MSDCEGLLKLLTLVVYRAASCNLAYTAAMQWEDRQCQLAKTVFGKNESYTLGGENVLLQAKDLVSHAVRSCLCKASSACSPQEGGAH